MKNTKDPTYRGLFSSDWNECLAPCGPFDVIAYHYPDLSEELSRIFKHYTGNEISLGQAAGQINQLLPAPITQIQMDTYLKSSFRCYTGVRSLIDWCRDHDVLFMINTTGAIGYFQRALALGLLPPIPILSAHPAIRFPDSSEDPGQVFELFEIQDKTRNTLAAARAFGIPLKRIMIMGDSGGDGPHFQWGNSVGASLVGSMTKNSLETYCREHGIPIDHRIGPTYQRGDRAEIEREMDVDFSGLIPFVTERLSL
ncbi:hypothetical protein D3OALGA1CA_1246 [Olavius algarvensis associated proteobacterium Delta 3]|nr:hypothetical protein D3OALGA1CA_1246 [Olavius algarvensis associated proteobacterium Delta 3]CAB5102813.1 hypothetical protein D3OALGB2SA_1941 [Olavius algarvensis associated proteobacterium Delta 3]